MSALYPSEPFYVAHRLFTGDPFPADGTWGDVLDGPVTEDEAVLEAITESFKGEIAAGDLPDRRNLRVWCITPDQPVEDCTSWAVREIDARVYDQGEAA